MFETPWDRNCVCVWTPTNLSRVILFIISFFMIIYTLVFTKTQSLRFPIRTSSQWSQTLVTNVTLQVLETIILTTSKAHIPQGRWCYIVLNMCLFSEFIISEIVGFMGRWCGKYYGSKCISYPAVIRKTSVISALLCVRVMWQGHVYSHRLLKSHV